LGVYATPTEESLVQSCLPFADAAIRPEESLVTGTPAGTVVVRAADLRVRGTGTVTAAGAAPSAGELALFCRPVVILLVNSRQPDSVAGSGRAGL
jgi:hypothetical protein